MGEEEGDTDTVASVPRLACAGVVLDSVAVLIEGVAVQGGAEGG